MTKIPLSALRENLGGITSLARWTTRATAGGRALLQQAGTPVSYQVSLPRPWVLSGKVALLTEEWRDGSGSVSARATATLTDGRDHVLWEVELRPASSGVPDTPRPVCAELPADTTALRLEVIQGLVLDGRSVARLLWIDPILTDSTATATATATPTAGSASDPNPPPEAGGHPLISVLTPVHDPPLAMLEECVSSVREQTYPHWELCLVDDGSRDPEVVAALAGYAAADERIKLVRNERPLNIAGATNRALDLATGEYIALLDHDDWLAPTALARVVERISSEPSLDMVYTDEDIVMNGRQIWVHRKQDWSPDVLRTNGYTCHLGVYRRRLVEAVGGFRSAFDGSQDVDMILRVVERTDRIAHVPEILYHWRAHPASTAGGDAKPYAYVSARNAITEHLGRIKVDGHVEFGPPGLYRVVHAVDPATTVGIAMSVEDADTLAASARSLLNQPHQACRLCVAAPTAEHGACTEALTSAGLEPERFELLATPSRAEWSGQRRLAAGLEAAARAAAAHAEQVLLLQAPAIGLTHDWITRLIGYATQPGIAVAGPLCLGPGGQILDAGVAVVNGLPLDLLYGQTTSMDDHFGFGTSVHNVSALRCAALTAAPLFDEIGLDPSFGDLMIVDYCLRAPAGQRVVTVPDARISLSLTPENDLVAMSRLAAHRDRTAQDPFYSPHYRADRGDFAPVEPLA